MRAFAKGRDIMAHDAKINRRRNQKPTKENSMNDFHPYPEDRANAIRQAKHLFELNPLFLDTETTGLADIGEICEIAVIDIEGNVLLESLVKPIRPIPDTATSIHGITNDMVRDAPTFKDILPTLHEILNGRTVLVYNAAFDQAVISNSVLANQIKWDGNQEGEFQVWWFQPSLHESCWHCAMELYAPFYGAWNDWHHSYRWQKLSNASQQCGITLPDNIHRAHADAELTRRILLYMAATDIQTNETQGE